MITSLHKTRTMSASPSQRPVGRRLAAWLLSTAVMAALAAPHGGPADCRAEMYVYGYVPNVNDRFNNSPDFLGAGYNFSGVGNVNAPYNSNQIGPWGTMISDQYFISATHFAPGVPDVLDFYSTNSTSGSSYVATVASWGQAMVDVQGNESDVWLGKLTAPIPTSDDITQYPIAYSPTGHYTGVNVYMYGSPDLLGYNQVSGTLWASVNSTEYGKFFTWNPTGATNQSYAVSGDSGGPQFAVVNGALALLGGTTFSTAAALAPHYLQQIEAVTGGQVATVALTIPGVYSWTGATSSDWNTGGNWSTSTSPTSSDTVSFNGSTPNTSVSLSSTGNALNVDFDGGVGYTVGAMNGPALNLAAGGSINVVGNMDTASQTVNAPIVLAGDANFSNDAVSNSNTLTIGGSVTGTAAGGSTDTLTLTGTNTGANAVNGVISDGSGGGNVAVAVTGGSWSLGGINTYSGGATVENGASLEYTNLAAFGSGAINIGTGSGTAQNGTLVAGVGGTLANNITSVAPVYTGGDVFNTNGVVTKLTGNLAGGGWTITGGGTLEYAMAVGHNSQNGDIVLGGTTLQIDAGAYFGYGYLFLGSLSTSSDSGKLVLASGSGTTVLSSLAGTSGSSINMASNTGIQDWGQGTYTYAGIISGAGSLTVDNINSWATGGTLTLNGTGGLANFTGTLSLDNRAHVNVAIATGLSGNDISFSGGSYGGNNATSQYLYITGSGSVTLGAVGMSATTAASTNTIDAGGSGNSVSLGAISAGTGGEALNTLVLQDGKFVLSGGIASGTVQVGSTGTLSNINFTLGSGATLNGSGTLTWNLNGNSGDLLTDNGALNITGLNLVLNLTGTQTLNQYVLVDYAGGTLTGAAFASVTGLSAGWAIDYSGTVLHPSSIVLSRVPEPASLGLLAVGGLGLLLVKRRKMA